MEPNIFDKIHEIDLKKTMEKSYIDYAMSVIASRALPDVRDGLKPVQRRVLYSMAELNNGPDKPHRKSARIVGDTMGKYHPHGDSSIYGALVNMAQKWSMRYMLVDGHGNFGSIDGDGAAAMRYTEARLSKISVEMLADIYKDTVDFIPNFDETEKEPTVLPSRFPNLLVNGGTGIAVGMATNIPPHNLREVIAAVVKIIDNQVEEGRQTSLEEILQIIKGPDFPTGAEILGTRGIEEAYRTGRGKIRVRAVTNIETAPNGKSHIIVTELPFVVGGGILIAIAFLIDGFSVDLNSLPADQRANFGTITQGAALFKGIGGTAFGFMLPILAGFIAMSIADRPGLAVGFVGGSIAANGTSGFLGALVAGFVAGYIVNLLKKIFSKLPESLDGVKPVLLYPLLGIFLIGVIMQFVVEPPIGALNTAINNGLNGLNGASAVVLGVLLGGMMAIDMGGPVNKAAYVFGTASIAAGNYNIMAAVMIGGMVPPLAIALATIFFKNKFTAEERKAGPTNFIMGLSFITEGAIPFAASDPLHVLPACAVGSAVAGGLSMAFGCTLMAPHGGIFVVPTIGNPLMYLVALVIGAFIACGLLGLLKKKVSE